MLARRESGSVVAWQRQQGAWGAAGREGSGAHLPSDLPSRTTSSTAPSVLSTSTRSSSCCCCAGAGSAAAPPRGSSSRRRRSLLPSRRRSLLRLRLRRRCRSLLRLRLLRRSRLWLRRRRSLLRLRLRSRRRSSSPPLSAGSGALGGGAGACALLPAGADVAPAGMKVTCTLGSTISATTGASAPWKPAKASALLLRSSMSGPGDAPSGQGSSREDKRMPRRGEEAEARRRQAGCTHSPA